MSDLIRENVFYKRIPSVINKVEITGDLESITEFDKWFLTNAPKLSEKASWLDPDAMAIRGLARHAWQASRECLVIELPPSIGVTPIGGDGIQEFIDCNGEYLHGHLVVDAIHAAGVKTK